MIMNDDQKDITKKFWTFVKSHEKDGMTVKWNLCNYVNVLYIYIPHKNIKDFVKLYMNGTDTPFDATLTDTYVCVKVSNFMNGHGFSMRDLMDYKDKEVE